MPLAELIVSAPVCLYVTREFPQLVRVSPHTPYGPIGVFRSSPLAPGFKATGRVEPTNLPPLVLYTYVNYVALITERIRNVVYFQLHIAHSVTLHIVFLPLPHSCIDIVSPIDSPVAWSGGRAESDY